MMFGMRRRARGVSVRLLLVAANLALTRSAGAQAPPEGAHRFWIELGLGASRQDPHCAGCEQPTTIGGPTATFAVGLTLTKRLGLALVGREFSEFSFENSHSATHYLALAQFA